MVVHICTRHVHEAKHPIPHHDALDATKWLLENASTYGGDVGNVVISGVSSGANLAAYVAQQFSASAAATHEKDSAARLKGQVLMVPWLIQPGIFPYDQFVEKSKTSLIQCADALGLSTERLDWLSSLLEAEDIADPTINPALVDDKILSSLPKTAILVAGADPLRDDGLLYATRLEKAGYMFQFSLIAIHANEELESRPRSMYSQGCHTILRYINSRIRMWLMNFGRPLFFRRDCWNLLSGRSKTVMSMWAMDGLSKRYLNSTHVIESRRSNPSENLIISSGRPSRVLSNHIVATGRTCL
ncbi:hypothetical protein EIK77_004295 [Talaromyces pinophilus]|nr:hypothetical protein EIK77_004295 [Talaromyces pinophilus]